MGCDDKECSTCNEHGKEQDIEKHMKNKAYRKEIEQLSAVFDSLKKGKPWSVTIEGMRIPQTLTDEEKAKVEQVTKNFKHVKVAFVKD
jgi:hypothetical protein